LYIALFHADGAPRGTFAPATAVTVMQTPGQPSGSSDADALYANRTDLSSAKRAAEIWESRLRRQW
jgi:hypothetical protein